jgi:coenzyme F420-reducing hydrogenase alpha subunit
MPKEGDLVVGMEASQGCVTHVDAHRERPRAIEKLLTGRPVGEAAMLVRSAFESCGLSHGVAAHMAVEAARGELRPSRHDIRERRIIGETLRHHGWRLFVDIPHLSGIEVPTDISQRERDALEAFLHPGEGDVAAAARTLLEWSERTVLGCSPGEFLQVTTLADFQSWMRAQKTPGAASFSRIVAEEPTLGANDVELMPAASEALVAALAARIEGEEGFRSHPVVAGKPRETGPLARQAKHPLVAAAIKDWGKGFGARAVARLVEMASLFASLTEVGGPRHGAVALGPGQAAGWAEVGNGLAIHCVRLEGEHIASYRALVPADWNFAPHGPFIRGAAAITGQDAAAIDRRVRRLVASLDPGVGLRLKRGVSA